MYLETTFYFCKTQTLHVIIYFEHPTFLFFSLLHKWLQYASCLFHSQLPASTYLSLILAIPLLSVIHISLINQQNARSIKAKCIFFLALFLDEMPSTSIYHSIIRRLEIFDKSDDLTKKDFTTCIPITDPPTCLFPQENTLKKKRSQRLITFESAPKCFWPKTLRGCCINLYTAEVKAFLIFVIFLHIYNFGLNLSPHNIA